MTDKSAISEQSDNAAAQKPAQSGFVYFLVSADCETVKVGYTDTPDMRLANANTWSAEDLNWEALFPASKADEQRIHALLKEHHLKREWFSYNDTVADLVEDLQDARLWLEIVGTPNASITECLAVENPKEKMDSWCEAHQYVRVSAIDEPITPKDHTL